MKPVPFRPLRFVSACLLMSLLATPAVAQGSGPTSLQLILDVSGSMYTRLESGETRIAVAQRVLTDLIGRLPDDPNLNVGLRVYGATTNATDAKACQDSALVLPMKGVARQDLLSTVNRTRPRGATPIVYSLQQAAQDFPATAGRKVIVLVTDGQESCGGDLKSALDAFRARGIEVDLQIVGIDLSARAQASFAGVGHFVNARSAGELAAALGQAVQQVAPPSQTRLPVSVTLTSGGQPLASGPTVSFQSSLGSGSAEALQNQNGVYQGTLLPGAYTATVRTSSGTQTFSGLTVSAGQPNRYAFEVGSAQPVTLQVTPSAPVAGSSVQVTYSGAPGGKDDWVELARKTDPDSVYLDWSPARAASGTLTLRVPDEENALEARYHQANPDGSSRVIGRSAAFTPRRVAATLDAPASALAGSALKVGWTGPNNPEDFVTVVPVGADPGAYLGYFYTRDGNPGTVQLPVQPGDYELRYVSANNRVVVSRPLQVGAATYSVQAPATAVAGNRIQVSWRGPNNPGEYVTVVPRGAPVGTYTTYFYTRDGNPGTLQLPFTPGEYEVRYSTEAASPNPTLASVPITLTAGRYSLDAPREAKAGSTIQVRWTGPNTPGEYVTIVKKGAAVGTYTTYFYTRDGNPGQLQLPAEPGEYELRYSTEAASPNPTLVSVPITLK
ncbi:VWA domain-containing protein [Deinococcus sonorensis]|uniref:VWA domain-containing protein n=2 Tax=Deinococcus sonorensis TaxID=309891 RepID=A0AAU7U7S6_9DEIO